MQWHGLVFHIQDILFPAYLRIVYFSHQCTDALEIFLTCIAHRHTSGHAANHPLGYSGHKGDITQYVATVHTNGQVSSVLTDLGNSRCNEKMKK